MKIHHTIWKVKDILLKMWFWVLKIGGDNTNPFSLFFKLKGDKILCSWYFYTWKSNKYGCLMLCKRAKCI